MATSTSTLKPKSLLICGAGIAGPAMAILLNQHQPTPKFHITILEKASQIRSTGQQIDISGNGQLIARMMGLEQEFIDRAVGEQGLRYLTEDNKVMAEFPAKASKYSISREIEILRGDMCHVLCEKAKSLEGVEFVFGDSVKEFKEGKEGVTVKFASGKREERKFDAVVIADGVFSKTRPLVFNDEDEMTYASFGMVGALFSIPWDKEKDGGWGTWMNAPGRRNVSFRPQPKNGITGAYLFTFTPDASRIARAAPEEQKREFQELFRHVGGSAPRALEHIDTTEDWYVVEIAQVKSKRWAKDRYALLGDAGYSPSAVTGQGTTLAFIGAYVLAGCLATYDDPVEALARYNEDMKPFVESSQYLPPGVPWVANPETAWGIWTLGWVAWTVSVLFRSGWFDVLVGLFNRLPGKGGLELPKYSGLRTEEDVKAVEKKK